MNIFILVIVFLLLYSNDQFKIIEKIRIAFITMSIHIFFNFVD